MKINIVFITDNNYVKPTILAISSLYNNNKNNTFDINILGKNLDSISVDLFYSLQKENFNINVIDATEYLKPFSNIIENRHVTKTAILKFYIPEIFKHLDKILYLDSDLIVRKNIIDFYNTNIDNFYAGVIKDTYTITNAANIKNLNLSSNIYFNSGVMLLNLKKMRKDNITNKLIKYRLNNNTIFMDQEAFNVVLNNNVKFLSYKYNFLNFYLTVLDNKKLSELFDEKLPLKEKELFDSCSIIHFGGKEKPWINNMGYLSQIYKEEKNKSILRGKIWQAYYEIIEDRFVENINNYQDKIIFWGASLFLKEFLDKYKVSSSNILGIIDTNPEKQGQTLGNYKIYSPDQIKELNPKYILLTIKNNNEQRYIDVQNFLAENRINTELLPNIFEEPLHD